MMAPVHDADRMTEIKSLQHLENIVPNIRVTELRVEDLMQRDGSHLGDRDM